MIGSEEERARREDEDPLVRFSALRALGGLAVPVSAAPNR